MSRRVVVVGDCVLDRDLDGVVERLAPDAPVPVVDDAVAVARPGGAGLAAVLAARSGHAVSLITALADDAAGRELAQLLETWGVTVVDLGRPGGVTPEKVRVRGRGTPLLRLDHGCHSDGRIGRLPGRGRAALAMADAVLVADYGRGVAAEQSIRSALEAAARQTPVVWDPHPRGAAPVIGVAAATPNHREAATMLGAESSARLPDLAEQARELVLRWGAAAVVVTLGERGALTVTARRPPLACPPPLVATGDSCGAGDCFAVALAAALAESADIAACVARAVDASARWLADGGVATVCETASTAVASVPAQDPSGGWKAVDAVVRRVRSSGGTVVAAGGCFDLLHAGHVNLLERARALGDCLVVCINSDSSVRRLKGERRPLVAESDRIAVLGALRCVDAVLVFAEDTPEAVLSRLRPDVFAKGADYRIEELPEAALLRTWGGQAVCLPLLEGRSTSALVERASRGRVA